MRHGWRFAFSIRSWSRSYAAASAASSATIFASPLPATTFMPAVEVNAERGIERAQLDELVGRDVERPQGRASPVERDVAADVDRMSPGLPTGPGRRSCA